MRRRPLPLPNSFSFNAGACNSVEAMPMQLWFNFDFENVYEFTDVIHSCELSLDAIATAMEEESLADAADANTLCPDWTRFD